MSDVDHLYAEFVRAWHAGAAPDADEYLARAPEDERDELAGLLNTFALVAPTVAPTGHRGAELRQDPALARAIALGSAFEAPTWRERLRFAREHAGVSHAELGRRFAAAFGLAGREERATTLLAELEDGRLEATGVSERAARRLAELLGQASDALLPPRPAALYRADPDADVDLGDLLAGAATALEGDMGSWDELDELLRGG
jgi:transcriptional regulator with XRE-family HTH domain